MFQLTSKKIITILDSKLCLSEPKLVHWKVVKGHQMPCCAVSLEPSLLVYIHGKYKGSDQSLGLRVLRVTAHNM